jgi:hypothetical protein
MIFKDIYTEVANRLGDAADTDLLAYSKTWANQAYQEIIRECATNTTLPWLRKRGTFTGTASTYIFPSYVGEIKSIKNQSYELTKLPIEQFDSLYPNATTTGVPTTYVPLGVVQYAAQVSAMGALSCYSSSDSDIPVATVSSTITVRGLSTGIERYMTIVLSGQNIVSCDTAGNTIRFDEIYSITKSVSTTGYITVLANTGTVSCAIIPPERLMLECQKIMLYPTPSSVSHTYNYLEKAGDLIQDNDQPRIPEKFHELIVLGAIARGMVWMEDDNRSLIAKSEFRQQLNNLIEYTNSYDAITEIPCIEDFVSYDSSIVEI